ncbi:MAG: hypothetical protein HY283_10365, partial [Nitrospirae bacterium]|nr:hypothetical protein [Nitrospirota bacterium]
PEATISLDTDWFYRKGGRGLLWLAQHPIARIDALLGEAYLTLILDPLQRLGRFLGIFDDRVIDGAVNGVSRGTQSFARLATATEKYVIYGSLNIIGYGSHIAARVLRRLQSGQVHHYAAFLVIGLFILVNLYLYFADNPSVLMIFSRLSLNGRNP